jgi:hypothetical protein
MKSHSHYLIFILVALMPSARAQINLGDGAAAVFASVEEAKQILSARDGFVLQMSPFDRAARLKTGSHVSEAEYLAFAAGNTLEWGAGEREKVSSAFDAIQEDLTVLSLPFPGKVLLIKTTGSEEGGAAYTRANAIILPEQVLGSSQARLQRTICHELFHILSRANPQLRDKLYAVIGFTRCKGFAFPPELEDRKITNPDAPTNDHCIRVGVGGREHWAIPILFSASDRYDQARGGEFFNYIEFRLLLVSRDEESSVVKPLYEGPNPRLVDVGQVSGFFEQTGRNTNYIIHPEEIMAENFALLMMRERNAPSPEILDELERILKNASRPPARKAVPDRAGSEHPRVRLGCK